MKSQRGARFISKDRGITDVKQEFVQEIQPIESNLKRLPNGIVKRESSKALASNIVHAHYLDRLPRCHANMYGRLIQCYATCTYKKGCKKLTYMKAYS